MYVYRVCTKWSTDAPWFKVPVHDYCWIYTILEPHGVKSGVEEIDLAGKVPDLEADEGAVGDVLSANLIGALQEESLVGGHLVEHHFLDGGFAAAP